MALACAGAMSLACTVGLPAGAATLVKAAIFPLGLMLITISSFALFTGNVYSFARNYSMKLSYYITLLFVNWFANFLGSVIMALVMYFTANLPVDPFIALAEKKLAIDPFILLLSGVAANLCVCLGVATSQKARTLGAKCICIFIPIAFFVAMGWEHSIANMFYLSYGYFVGANITWGQIIFSNLIPVTIGNILGGLLILLYVGYQTKSDA